MRNLRSAVTIAQPDSLSRRTFLKNIPQAAAYFGGLSILAHLTPNANFLQAAPAGPRTWPPFEKVKARLEQWERQYPRLVKLDNLGQTAQGRALLAATLTDSSVDNETKEHVILTAQHSGVEHSGAMALVHTMGWLLSGDPLARETLQRQVLVCMPVVNPDGYEAGTHPNSVGVDPHYAWTIQGPKDPEKSPEAVALKTLIDRNQPEVLTDLHGLDMSFPGYYMGENIGGAYQPEIMRLIDEAALREGYPTDQGNDGVRILGLADKLGMSPEKLGNVGSSVDPGMYSYNRYHTIRLVGHSAWERSGFLRQRRLLEIGNEVWPGEFYHGYPTRVVMKNLFHSITAYGQTAAARRRSRIELWNKQRQIVHGFNNPQTEGLLFYVCATSPEAVQNWLAADKNVFDLRTLPVSLKNFRLRIKERLQVDAQALEDFIKDHPEGPGQWGPEAGVSLQGGGARPGESSPIEHGLSMRLSLPYSRARILDLRMNGHPISKSETDGFLTWVARGFTYIQVNVPPEKSRRDDFFIISCRFDPAEKRSQGEGW